ncbi:MAG: hypothetical protein F6J94_32295, partial [Moorea sp. SIO1F2]|nr:hypothetical protein [Moorena sp. SIO1F2]
MNYDKSHAYLLPTPYSLLPTPYSLLPVLYHKRRNQGELISLMTKMRIETDSMGEIE